MSRRHPCRHCRRGARVFAANNLVCDNWLWECTTRHCSRVSSFQEIVQPPCQRGLIEAAIVSLSVIPERHEAVGWAKPTGRANARPMTGSACPPFKAHSERLWARRDAPLPTLNSPSLRVGASRPGMTNGDMTQKCMPHQRNLPVVPICRGLLQLISPPNQWFPWLVSFPIEGRLAIVTDVGCGMRWTRQRQARGSNRAQDE